MEATEPPKLKETKAELKEIVKEFVEKHDNHQGVVFYDIFPIFRVPDATNALFSLLLQHEDFDLAISEYLSLTFFLISSC